MRRKAEVGDVIKSKGFALSSRSTGRIKLPPIILVGSGKTERSRGRAWYVVEEAAYHVSPIGTAWQVTARRLNADGTYDPNGELISFYQEDGIYSWNKVMPPDIALGGKMNMHFEWKRRPCAA